MLLKEMTLCESKILSFFVYGVNQGGWRGGGEFKTSLCNLGGITKGVKLSDLPRAGWPSLLCVEGLWMMNLTMVGFCSIGRDSSPGIGCLVHCLPVCPKYDTSCDAAIPETGARFLCTRLRFLIGSICCIFLYDWNWENLGTTLQ